MATVPSYAATVGTEHGTISTANTNRDGTGTIGTILTAGASGTRIERIKVKATGTTTAGMVRLFLHDGSAAKLTEEIPVSAITPSATVESFEADVVFGDTNPLILPSGWSLRASTHNAESFNVLAVAGDF
jgi:hypothetical protein